MKLIALILGLALEHGATRGLRLRELRWFDPYFDVGLSRAKALGSSAALPVLVLLLVAAVLPVVAISVLLARAAIPWDLPYLLFAVLILFVSVGPRDLASEVDDYCAALDEGDYEGARRALTALAESSSPAAADADIVEDAVFTQATNRVFGVAFWFVVLGPVGAWLFRVSNLMRRRAVFESARDPELGAVVLPAAEALHGVLAWAPARLAALGYALGGSFDDAVNGWRSFSIPPGGAFRQGNDRLVAVVGKAAMTGYLQQPVNSSAAARNSLRLVMRALFIWLTVIALMTLFGWAI